MRTVGVLVMLAVTLEVGCYAQTPVITWGEGESEKQVQRIELAKETPPRLVASDQWSGGVSVVKIRVWADEDYRAQNLRWQRTFAAELAYANEVLVPMLGLRLEADYRDWAHRPVPGTRLEATAAALAQHDPGSDVFLVVGLASGLPLVSETFDQLGVGMVGGKHLVVRGFADGKEREVFERYFRTISKRDRQRLYEQRRRHKTAAVLLHEIGHTLGAAHDPDADTIMSEQYAVRAATFTTQSRDTMLATVNERLRRADPAPARATIAAATAAASIEIRVDASGAMLVGGVALDDVRLDTFLRLNHADDPNAEVVVLASPSAPAKAVARTVDIVKFAGFQRVAVRAAP